LGFSAANQMANPILNMTLGLNPVWISTSRFINMLIDACTDPLMGHISDNFTSKWGRRRPFILLGGLWMSIVLAAFWWVPLSWNPLHIMVWYLVVSILFSLGTTIFGTAYWALGVELTPDYNERIRINAIRSYFQSAMGLAAPWFIWFISRDFWASGQFGNAEFGRVYGTRGLFFILAAFCLVFSIIPVFFVRERYKNLAAKNKKDHGKRNFFRSFFLTFNNKPFLILTFCGIIMGTSLQLFEQFGNYVNFYYVFGGNIEEGSKVAGWAGMIGWGMALAGIPLVHWVSLKAGKHNAVRIALISMIIGDILKWFCYTPEFPYLQLVVPIFYSIGISSYFVAMGSMSPDVVDYDEFLTGDRREALFSGVGSFVGKAIVSISVLCSGFILNWTGFDVALKGAQAPGVFTSMRLFFSFAPGIACVICLVVISFYPLTHDRMHEVRVGLEKRRGRY
jgi:glycoside/pentoside/hexuronide:cation symporter, GPH family